jgi:CRISPR/Cas system-associated exonuclease Cas4 (RecB family)
VKVPINGLEIVGETDQVLIGDNGEIEKLFEVKSTAERGFTYREDKPSRHHVYQVHPYMKGLNLNSCEIIYVSVPDLREAHHIIKFSPRTWSYLELRMIKLHNAIMQERPPEAKPFEKWECNYCEYQEECKGD